MQPEAREIVGAPPTEQDAPKLYNWTAVELGIIAALCVVGCAVLAALRVDAEAVITGLVSIAALAVGGLVRLMEPRKQ